MNIDISHHSLGDGNSSMAQWSSPYISAYVHICEFQKCIFSLPQALLRKVLILGTYKKSYVKIRGGSGWKKKKRKRSGRSWYIRFGEYYNLSRERIGLGVWGKKKVARGRNEKPENAGIEKQPRNGQVRVESEVLWDDSKAFCQIGYPRGHKSSRYIGKTIKSRKMKKICENL